MQQNKINDQKGTSFPKTERLIVLTIYHTLQIK